MARNVQRQLTPYGETLRLFHLGDVREISVRPATSPATLLGMTPATLYPPIAAATIANVFLFALMWRGTQIERQRGQAPWWLILGFLGYAALACAFLYYRLDAQVADWIDIFGTAAVAEAFGASVVYAILHAALFSRGQPVAQRGFALLVAIVLTAGMFAGLFMKT